MITIDVLVLLDVVGLEDRDKFEKQLVAERGLRADIVINNGQRKDKMKINLILINYGGFKVLGCVYGVDGRIWSINLETGFIIIGFREIIW